MAYNPRRCLLSAIPTQNLAYYLFDVGYNSGKNNHLLKLKREAQISLKSPQSNRVFLDTSPDYFLSAPISSLDIDPEGELIAADYGKTCVVAKIDTQRDSLHHVLGTLEGKCYANRLFNFEFNTLFHIYYLDKTACLRWSTNRGAKISSLNITPISLISSIQRRKSKFLENSLPLDSCINWHLYNRYS